MTTKIKQRRFCLLLCYCGKDYFGMQRNPGTKTIEEYFLRALRDTEIISEENFNRPQSMYFQRAARTDKRVSAIRQIVSLKCLESIKDKIELINQKLPNDIRLMGCKRATQSFDAKNYCDARTYSYLMPSLALCPLSDQTTENYRASPETIDLLNETLKSFVGTHTFHNFTSGKNFKDPSSTRHIKFMYCSEPFFPCNQNELEFVVIRVKGQSFMMHQIRKMIGLAIAVVKGFATAAHIKRSMEEPYMDIPKAPGLGLMLENVHFDRYDKRFGGDGHHEKLEWFELSGAIDDFKEKFIYPVVVDTELKDKSMFKWLSTLTLHSYGDGEATFRPLRDLIIPLKRETNSKNPEDESEDTSDKKRIKLDNQSPELDIDCGLQPKEASAKATD